MLPERNLLARTALLSVLGSHGMGNQALEIFRGIRSDGGKPHHLAFIGAMIACSHAGLLEEGLRLFESMKQDYGLEPISSIPWTGLESQWSTRQVNPPSCMPPSRGQDISALESQSQPFNINLKLKSIKKIMLLKRILKEISLH